MDRAPEPGAAGPAQPASAHELAELAAVIARSRARRRRFVVVCLGAIGLGLVLMAVGVGLARARALRVLEREIANTAVDPATGIRLGMAARTLAQPNARAAVLMVHGWCSGPTDFADLPERLHARGFHVRVMLLPGHGTSPRDFAAATADDWRDAVRGEVDALAGAFQTVHAVGFSMGGALLVELAAERDLGRLAVLAPFFGLPFPTPLDGNVGALAGSLQGVLPYIDSGPGVRTLRCREYEDRFKKYRALPLAAMVQADVIGRAVDDDALLARVTEPLLVVAAPDDPVASAERALAALARTNSIEPRSFIAENSEHILCFDCDAEAVKAAVVDFMIAAD